MLALEPVLRKQFRCTTIGLRGMTASECLSQLFLANCNGEIVSNYMCRLPKLKKMNKTKTTHAEVQVNK